MNILKLSGIVLLALCFASCKQECVKKSWEKVDHSIQYAENNHITVDSALSKFGLLPFPYYKEQFSSEPGGK